MMKRFALLILALAFCLPAAHAQTFDPWGGLITYTNGATAPTCTWPVASHDGRTLELGISSITGNGTTATITVSSTAALGPVGNHKTIYVTGVTNSGFNVTTSTGAGIGVLATIASSTTLTYANATNATSSGGNVVIAAWYWQEISSRMYYCTPAGHIFQSFHPAYVSGTIHGSCAITTSGHPGVLDRIEGWGFNTIGPNSYSGGCNGSHGLMAWNATQTLKAPVIPSFSPVYRAASNQSSFLSDPIKDIFYGQSATYTGYRYSLFGDFFDPNFGTWITDDMGSSTNEDWVSALKNSAYDGFILGFYSDDSDYTNSGLSGCSNDFTCPSGNQNNMGMFVATASPLIAAATNIAGNGFNFVYTRTRVFSKLQMEAALKTEYSSSISALNTAWGSSYTTWDSSGVCVGSQPITCASSVAADSVGTGDGSTLTFSTTLTHTTISAHSLQILVAGTPVAGDLGNGTFYGPNIGSASINYSTGVFSITFAAGHAPANLAAITAAYVANGWGIGTGFLDEDARVSHQSYTGTNYIGATSGSAAFAADCTSFHKAMATQYFSTIKTNVQATFPWLMFFGPNQFGSWGGVPWAPSMQGAAGYLDAALMGGGTSVQSQAQLNYVKSNLGTIPIMTAWYGTSNNDSQYNKAYSGITFDFSSQTAAAQSYYNMVQAQLTTAVTSSGDNLYVGAYWWDYPAQSFEGDGLVTPSDNAYNGVEASVSSTACSAPISLFTCGSEPAPASNGGSATRPYGNLITGTFSVTTANDLWLQQPSGGTGPAQPRNQGGVIVSQNVERRSETAARRK